MKLIKSVRNWLGIKTQLMIASELPDTSFKGTELIIHYCETLKADVYLSGTGGKNYLKEDQFIDKNIKLEYQQYDPVIYPQRFGAFIPNLSVIDLIFNCGNESLPRIMGRSKI